jgi:acetyl esterase/lipase
VYQPIEERFMNTSVRGYVAAAIAIVVQGAALSAQSTNPLDLLKEGVAPGEHISYGSGALQFGELRVPDGPGSHPVAILVHGGCWLAKLGQLPEAATSLDTLRPLSAALAQRGIATWNVEYRRIGNDGGGWPGTYDDLSKAADFLRELAPKRHLDLQRVVLVGHSSGGHLALWTAARHKLPADSALHTASPLRVAGVVDIDGPPDLESVIGMERLVCGAPVVEQLLGGSPSELPSRYQQASATGLLPIGTKQELLIADKHNAQWIESIKAYATAAKNAGDSVTVTMMQNAGHFDGLNPKAPAWDTVLTSIRSILGTK